MERVGQHVLDIRLLFSFENLYTAVLYMKISTKSINQSIFISGTEPIEQ